MSFLKQDSNQRSNNLTTSSSKKLAALPASYSESQCQVILEPVSKPVSTAKYVRENHQQQLAVAKKLKGEAPELFKSQSVIVKEQDGERMYKQKLQFDSKISVESLIECLENENLVLRCSFKRPGFNSQNCSYQITAESLRQLVQSEANEHNLKQMKYYVGGDEANKELSGYVIFALKPSGTNEHIAYSVDYHALTHVDDKLFSEH